MSDINVQTFSGKVNVANNLKVGTNHFFVDTQNNNVGIGTSDPTHTLDVQGTANVGVLTATLAGIGTDNPTHTLDVEGTANVGVLTATSAGIGTTTAPTRTLEVGSNLYVEDTGSNVLVVDGNVAATSITIGDATIVASQGLDHVTNENNTTTQVVQFNNPTTGFVTASNAVIGGTLSLQNFALSQSYGLENVTDVNNTTGDTIISSNATTGFQSTANVSVGRDALVTGNVTVGKDLTVSEEATFSSNVTINKDLEVSGNVTNLDVLSNVNLLSVSNVVSIKKDSNVVTEFTRSKKLIKYPRVAMSQDDESGTSGYVATNNSGYTDSTGRIPYKAFNNTRVDGDDCWQIVSGGATDDGYSDTDGTYTGSTRLSSNTPLGEWLKLESPVAFKLQLYKISPRNSPFYNDQAPRDAEIWGSNDDTNWTKITEYSGLEFTSQTDSRSFSINSDNGKYFKYHAIIVTKNGADQFYAISIGELEYYGVPEYDPEADGVDVKVKSVPNVPNTDWLEVYYDAKDLTGVPSPVLDLSGNSRNGTATNVTVSDGAFVFDGSGDYIESQNITTLSGNQVMSSSVWVKFNSWINANVDMVFSLGDRTGGNGKEYALAAYHSGTAASTNGLYVGIYGYNAITSKVIPDLNRWYHFVTTHNGSNHQIFINGVLITSSVSNGDVSLPTSGCDLVLGGDTSSTRAQFMNGSIANFRLFNRALTTDEVWQLYAYQKEYFGHGDLSMTLKAGRLGIGTSEPKATLDIRGEVLINGYQLTSMYPGFASGGDDVYDVDGYRIHVFTNSGTFNVPGNNISADVLVIGGGGGGGQDNAGGGGAGGLIFKPNHTFAGRGASGGRDGAYIITIGSGGTGSPQQNSVAPTAGGDTIIKHHRSNWGTNATYTVELLTTAIIFTAKGGGPGNNGGSAGASTIDGGSGGGQDGEVRNDSSGGTATQPSQSGDSGIYGYGNNGGASAYGGGGGGGGAGEPGENAAVTLGAGYGGYGGDGLSGVSGYDFAEIFGTRYGEVVGEDVYFAGGGAGGNNNNATTNGFALGGKGGGGSAGQTPSTNENGLPGTGGGGAGAYWNNSYEYNLWGGNGGSGIVMIRYKL